MSSPSDLPAPSQHHSASVARSALTSRTFWGGLAVVAMWMAVLFVGVFGGNLVKFSAGGETTSIPATIAIALFAMFATIAVAHAAFATSSKSDDVHAELEDERRVVKQLADEVSQLRAKLAR